MRIPRSVQFILFMLLLLGVTWLSHVGLVRAGRDTLNSDYAPLFTTADRFLRGEWSAFHFGMDYGGTTLTAMRALCVKAYLLFFGTEPLMGHLWFTFFFDTVLLSWATVILVGSTCSRSAMCFVGLLAAFGFQFWINTYGNEIYLSYLIFGSLLLAWRARFSNAWTDLSGAQLVLAGAISGHAAYNSRAALIYIVAFFLPWKEARQVLQRLFSPQDAWERWIVRVVWVLIAFGLYLEVFGPDLGTIGVRKVRVHAGPNFQYAAILLAGLAIKAYRGSDSRTLVRKVMLVGAGFLIGFSPELIHWASQGMLPPQGLQRTFSFGDSINILGKTPGSLKTLMTRGGSITQNASVLLLLGALFCFVRSARRDRRLQGVALAGALALFAYVRTFTYAYAPPRYLLPIFPLLLVGLGLLWDAAWAQARRSWAIAGLSILAAIHLLNQWEERQKYIAENQREHRYEKSVKLVETFRAAEVPVVVSNDYWESNQYTVVSREHPIFISDTTMQLRHPQGLEILSHVHRIGVLLKEELPDPRGGSRKEVVLYGRRWGLTPLGRQGDLDLYVGEEKGASPGPT